MTAELVRFVQSRLAPLACAENARAMAAYMKSEMPFYGVKTPDRRPISREAVRRFPPEDRQAYERGVLALWRLPHREEKYAAIAYARGFRAHIGLASLPLYERFVREGRWWDFIDEIAAHLVGKVLLDHRDDVRPLMDRWVADDDMWIRRTAILSQLRHKQRTDAERLFAYCLARAHEKEFFIRKAIGWALREYSYAAPEAVRDFIVAHRDELSPLSVREGAKRLAREGVAPFG